MSYYSYYYRPDYPSVTNPFPPSLTSIEFVGVAEFVFVKIRPPIRLIRQPIKLIRPPIRVIRPPIRLIRIETLQLKKVI